MLLVWVMIINLLITQKKWRCLKKDVIGLSNNDMVSLWKKMDSKKYKFMFMWSYFWEKKDGTCYEVDFEPNSTP